MTRQQITRHQLPLSPLRSRLRDFGAPARLSLAAAAAVECICTLLAALAAVVAAAARTGCCKLATMASVTGTATRHSRCHDRIESVGLSYDLTGPKSRRSPNPLTPKPRNPETPQASEAAWKEEMAEACGGEAEDMEEDEAPPPSKYPPKEKKAAAGRRGGGGSARR